MVMIVSELDFAIDYIENAKCSIKPASRTRFSIFRLALALRMPSHRFSPRSMLVCLHSIYQDPVLIFQMAEVAMARQTFQEILRLVAELRPKPPPAPA